MQLIYCNYWASPTDTIEPHQPPLLQLPHRYNWASPTASTATRHRYSWASSTASTATPSQIQLSLTNRLYCNSPQIQLSLLNSFYCNFPTYTIEPHQPPLLQLSHRSNWTSSTDSTATLPQIQLSLIHRLCWDSSAAPAELRLPPLPS